MHDIMAKGRGSKGEPKKEPFRPLILFEGSKAMALYDDLKWPGPFPESAWSRLKGCDRKSTRITKEDAHDLIEDVIDTLIEAGNGTTDEMLHESADKLFVVRDCFIEQE